MATRRPVGCWGGPGGSPSPRESSTDSTGSLLSSEAGSLLRGEESDSVTCRPTAHEEDSDEAGPSRPCGSAASRLPRPWRAVALTASLAAALVASARLGRRTARGSATAARGAPSFEAARVVGLEGEECEDAAQGTPCYDAVAWVMQTGIYEHPEWFDGLDKEARFEEVQARLHDDDPDKPDDQKSQCKMPCKDPKAAKRYKGVPASALDLPILGPYAERQDLEFYMFRAQGESDYPLENVDTADLAGVMWYLHNEIVVAVGRARKYNVTRIKRFKINLKTTWAYYNSHRRQFGSFVAFDSGHCTVPDCDQIWTRFGAIPGCQHVDTERERAAYMSDIKTYIGDDCEGYKCRPPVWYSLPGPCPNHNYEEKTDKCKSDLPGGLCDSATGERDCTFSIENAGEVSLDVVTGIDDYVKFFEDGGIEYSERRDKGVKCSFWDGKHDEDKCKERVDKVKKLFDEKYPDMPRCDDLPGPPCDTDGYYQGELEASLDEWPTHEDGALEYGEFGKIALGEGDASTKSSAADEKGSPSEPSTTSSSLSTPAPTEPSSTPAPVSQPAATTAAATEAPAEEAAKPGEGAAGEAEGGQATDGGGGEASQQSAHRPLEPRASPVGEEDTLSKERAFKVVLDHSSSSEILGLAFTMVDEAIIVDGVTGGLFEKWNEEHPDEQVQRGDIIVAVNGARGNSMELAEKLKQAGELEVELQALDPHPQKDNKSGAAPGACRAPHLVATLVIGALSQPALLA